MAGTEDEGPRSSPQAAPSAPALTPALTSVLARRGYACARVRAGGRELEGEVLRLPLPSPLGRDELVVTAREPRPRAELELVVELVGEAVARGELSPGEREDAAIAEGGAGTGAEARRDGRDVHDATPGEGGATGPSDSRASILGGSPAMLELFGMIERLSATDSTSVLIQGENGTGKELVAHAIHRGSPRRERRFVVTNCSAFNDNLLDSELFGHARGAFTGATADKPGLFEAADGGTFFLDEIGDMSPALQAKVLRVLQDGTFNRVGDPQPRQVDVRILAATNRDLAAMVLTGEFREDLYYRINVVNLVVPPLRERRDDIPLLIEAFLERHSGLGGGGRGKSRGGAVKALSAACTRRMIEYSWPGNVRELENEVERLVVLAGDAEVIELELLTPRIRDAVVRAAPENPESLPEAVESLEREMIAAALMKYRGNKSRAALALQVSRRNLIRLVQKYDLDRD
jgi:two-component system, NtrC family, response regulator HupR/HoxA